MNSDYNRSTAQDVFALEPSVFYELTAVRGIHTFLDRGDLPVVNFHELWNGLRGLDCATAGGRLGKFIQTSTSGSIESQLHGIAHDVRPQVVSSLKICFTFATRSPTSCRSALTRSLFWPASL